jgi:hypothetical protein
VTLALRGQASSVTTVAGTQRFTYHVALGAVERGRHRVSLHLFSEDADTESAQRTWKAWLDGVFA